MPANTSAILGVCLKTGQTFRKLFFAAAALTVAACNPSESDVAQAPQAPPAVTVSQPLVREIVEWDEYTGRFQAVETVDVRSRVSGYLDSINFTDGEIVNEGDLLFIIDQRPFRVALAQAEAELNQARTRADLAAKDLERARPLLQRGNISQAVFDERLQGKQEADAAVRSAIATVDAAKLDLEYSEIRAPVTGRISRYLVSVGNLVTGGTANATLLTTIVSLDPIHFFFDANEAAYLKYVRLDRTGQRTSSRAAQNPVQLSLLDEIDFPHTGRMDFVENRLDQQTATIRARAVFDNGELLFLPGMFGRIRLIGSGRYDAIMLPDEAIGTDQSRKFVYVLDENDTVGIRLVELGPIIDGLRVIRDGLGPEDRVIIDGLQRARPGAPVTPQEGPIEVAQTNPTAQ